jgi:hypothetical protein
VKKLIAIVAGLGVLLGGVVFAQTPIPYVTSLGQSDIMQAIKNANPQAGNTYATLTQLRAWLLGGASGHSATPSLGATCGTAPAIVGSDFAGRVTAGTGTPTSCVVTFALAFTAAPACAVASETAPGTTTPHYTISTTAITITQAANDSTIYDFICIAKNGG